MTKAAAIEMRDKRITARQTGSKMMTKIGRRLAIGDESVLDHALRRVLAEIHDGLRQGT